jgi:hypothetical protein
MGESTFPLDVAVTVNCVPLTSIPSARFPSSFTMSFE